MNAAVADLLVLAVMTGLCLLVGLLAGWQPRSLSTRSVDTQSEDTLPDAAEPDTAQTHATLPGQVLPVDRAIVVVLPAVGGILIVLVCWLLASVDNFGSTANASTETITAWTVDPSQVALRAIGLPGVIRRAFIGWRTWLTCRLVSNIEEQTGRFKEEPDCSPHS